MNELNILRSFLKNLESKAVESSGATISESGQARDLQHTFEGCKSVLIDLIRALVNDPLQMKLVLKSLHILFPAFSECKDIAVFGRRWPLSPEQDIETLRRVRKAGNAIVAFCLASAL
jgi:hypothetical protein